MEIGDLLLAEFPAEVDFAALVMADEIDQPGLKVFELAANLGEFIEIAVKLVDRDVEVLLNAFLLLGAGGLEVRLQLRRLLASLHDVIDDAPHQGQRAVSLLQRKTPARAG